MIPYLLWYRGQRHLYIQEGNLPPPLGFNPFVWVWYRACTGRAVQGRTGKDRLYGPSFFCGPDRSWKDSIGSLSTVLFEPRWIARPSRRSKTVSFFLNVSFYARLGPEKNVHKTKNCGSERILAVQTT